MFFSKDFTDLLLTGADYYDKLGRTIRKVTIGFNGAKFYTDTKYNSKGQVTEVTDPYPSGSYSGKKTVFTYDDLGRVYTETYANGVVKTYNYDDAANKVSTTFSTGESYTKTYDPAGQVIEAADPGGTITYKYNSANKPVQILSPGSKTEIKYDDFGRQDTLIEPNAGTIAYTYNPYGELASQTNANGKTTTMQYDKLGRVLKKTVGSITTDYAYDRGTRALGTTSSISRSDGARESYSYSNDGLCRLISQTRSNGTDSFAYAYNYDTKGRRQKLTYPSGFAINYTYTDYDEVLELRKSDGSLIWKLDETNPANGQMQKATYGNGQQINYSYDNEDRLTRIYVPGIIDFNYQFNNKQQLDWREEKYYIADSSKWKGFKENFGYDAVNRLDTVTGGAASLTMVYSGNHILSKSDVGTYAYQNGNHRIDELTAVAGYVPCEHHLTYTAEGKVDTLTELTDSTTVKKFSFGYGLDNQRFSMKYLVNDTLKYTRYYDGNYEKEVKADGTVRHLNYIYAGNGIIAIFEQESGSDTTHYVYTDYLGSLRCITDSTGTTKQTFGFDAWGNRRNPITGTLLPSFGGTGGGLYRGYTGHEHLDEVGLINMNGRVYDPGLGMFISPDNYVQAPDFSQNFNRYSYCYNNPLMYTDPDGEWIHIVIGAAIGGVVNLGIKAYQGKIQSWGDGFAAFGIGAVAGAVGAATGGAAFTAMGGAAGGAGGFFAGAAGGAVGSATSMPIQSLGNSAYFGDPMMTGKQYLMGIGIGGLFGGTINGSIALGNGRSFWNGSLIPQSSPITSPLPIVSSSNPSPEIKLPNNGRAQINTALEDDVNVSDWIRNSKFEVNSPKSDITIDWKVGRYNELRKISIGSGWDAHHAGQKAILQRLIPNYDANTGPAIMVPRIGHTIGPNSLSRITDGFTSARQVLARDILELRRVYPNIPNNALQDLINLNKILYPLSFIK